MERIEIKVNVLNNAKHEYLKDLFGFPDYYGNNLDALYDCLSEKNNLLVVFDAVETANDFSRDVIMVFEDVAEEFDNMYIIYSEDMETGEEDEI